jgi:anti-anti-sigma regulatory factor
LANGRKLAKPRTRSSGGKPAGKAHPAKAARAGASKAAAVAATADEPLSVAAAMAPAAPATLVGEVASASPDPAPDAIIHLGAQLTIREAVPLRAELLERVDAVDLVALDASGVQKVDTAGLQVLLAFTRQRRAAAVETIWTGCSEVLRKAAAALDLAQALGLPAGAAS